MVFHMIFWNRTKNSIILKMVALRAVDWTWISISYYRHLLPKISLVIQMNPGEWSNFATFEIHIADLQMPFKYEKRINDKMLEIIWMWWARVFCCWCFSFCISSFFFAFPFSNLYCSAIIIIFFFSIHFSFSHRCKVVANFGIEWIQKRIKRRRTKKLCKNVHKFKWKSYFCVCIRHYSYRLWWWFVR